MGRDARATDVSDWPWLRRRRPRCMCCELLVLPFACCACNQIEWLLASSALWNSGAAGGGVCSVVVGLHSLTPLQCAPPAAHGLCQHGFGLNQHLACLASSQQAVLAPLALQDGGAAGGGACNALVGLHSLAHRARTRQFSLAPRARSPPGRRPRRLQPCNDPGRPLRSHGRPLPCQRV